MTETSTLSQTIIHHSMRYCYYTAPTLLLVSTAWCYCTCLLWTWASVSTQSLAIDKFCFTTICCLHLHPWGGIFSCVIRWCTASGILLTIMKFPVGEEDSGNMKVCTPDFQSFARNCCQLHFTFIKNINCSFFKLLMSQLWRLELSKRPANTLHSYNSPPLTIMMSSPFPNNGY